MSYYIYILASKSRRLYTGVINDLHRRTYQHRTGACEGFTKQYRIDRLVHYEIFGQIRPAIVREKEIKAWRRQKRTALIESDNPLWRDLYEDLFVQQKLAGTASKGPKSQ